MTITWPKNPKLEDVIAAVTTVEASHTALLARFNALEADILARRAASRLAALEEYAAVNREAIRAMLALTVADLSSLVQTPEMAALVDTMEQWLLTYGGEVKPRAAK